MLRIMTGIALAGQLDLTRSVIGLLERSRRASSRTARLASSCGQCGCAAPFPGMFPSGTGNRMRVAPRPE